MSSPLQYYQEKIDQYQAALQQTKKQSARIAFLRLLCFGLAAIAAYCWFFRHLPATDWLSIAFLLVFFLLVNISFRLSDRKAREEKMLFINMNELSVLQGGDNAFDNGKQYLQDEGYWSDLDIFGPYSLFHLLNRTTTTHGETHLASLLKHPYLSAAVVREQQQAIEILSGQTGLRQEITVSGLLRHEDEGNLHDIATWLQQPNRLYHRRWLQWARWIIPAFNMAAIIVYIVTGDIFIKAGILASWLIVAIFLSYTRQQHSLLAKKQAILERYASILKVFCTARPGDSRQLRQLQSIAFSANRSIAKLSRLSGYFDWRHNLIINLLLNSFFCFDIQCLLALEAWRHRHRNQFAAWIDCVGAIESLNSLATFAYNHPSYCRPAVAEGDLHIDAVQLAHPLIPPGENVANDLHLGHPHKLLLITGSNMSGKTTFLRTVGVNVLLAQCGAPVYATSFSFTPMQLLSSIRVSDSLQEHTSYFMAELKRLQQIIRALEQGQPALVLIDEILRGTNSEDKTHGSEQFIRKLLQYNCLTLFATHDLSLGKLEQELPGLVANACFESVIETGELHFDYTLRSGVARNKNASFLMEKMGIV